MKLFDFFKKRKSGKDKADSDIRTVRVPRSFDSYEDRESFVCGNCEIIVSSDRHLSDAKREYTVVTEYLSDIQKIDMIPEKGRNEVNESAKRIINLNGEREKMTRTPSKITISQKAAIEAACDTIEEQIGDMEKNESYLLVVESDLRTLEGERDGLDYEINDAINRADWNRKILTGVAAFILLVLITLIYIQQTAHVQVTPVYVLVAAFGGGSAVWFLTSHRKNQKEQKDNEAKLQRAIFLLNKVKIKYVNVVNVLDYGYEKFHVQSSRELRANYEEYRRIMEEERRFRQAEELIDFYNDDLKKRLRAYGVQDTDIWVCQCEALLDEREMVEVRHRLNVRRQKLRNTIELNTGQGDSARQALRSYIEENPDREYETHMIMDRYKLSL